MFEAQLSPFNKKVVDAFRALPYVVGVYLDSPSEEPGRGGHRYSVVVRGGLGDREQALTQVCYQLRDEDPDYAWNFWEERTLDDHPRVALWTEAGVVNIGGATVSVRQQVWLAFKDVPEVVDVTCSPSDVVSRGQKCHVSVVLRAPMRPPPLELLRTIDERAKELRKVLPEIVEMQAAPELNFPPSGARLDDPNDSWLELKAEVMRIVEKYRFVIAAYFRAPDEQHEHPTVYVFGEDAPSLLAELRALDEGDLCVHAASNPYTVPREAKCIFNNVTRLIKAQAEGNADEIVRLRGAIMGQDGPKAVPHPCVVCGKPAEAACSVCHAEYGGAWLHVCTNPACRTQHEADERRPELIRQQIAAAARAESAPPGPGVGAVLAPPNQRPRPRAVVEGQRAVGPVRGDPATHVVHCRWCGELTPASTNPSYHETCDACGALQAATTIPTKSLAMPLISLFVNPDRSIFVEFVFSPPQAGRFDLSKVWRYTISAAACEEFDEHPMGKRREFTKRGV